VISGVTIRNGTAHTGPSVCIPGADGGGIRVLQGSLTLNDVAVSGNDAVNVLAEAEQSFAQEDEAGNVFLLRHPARFDDDDAWTQVGVLT
jgi:hypothetical protein